MKLLGYDAVSSENTDRLISHGIKVVTEHNLSDINTADLVVYTAAISPDDPELVEAHNMNIPCVERSEFVGYLTRAYENTIGISGTHGKTTTTSMISLCFIEAGLDPTIQVGADLKQIDGNYRLGNGPYFILEACEYVESFLKFSPKSEIVLNIDNDHLDYFKTFDNVKNAFIKYVKIIPDDGLLVVNGDDHNCLDLPQYTNAKSLTYGITNKNTDFFATNIVFDKNGFASFDVYAKDKFYERISLSTPGMHNVQNALACIALCNEYGISSDCIKSALSKFTGAHRRFEFVGDYQGISVYDDYGHHPTEIVATAKALMNKTYHESWVVFQPHTYSRTLTLLDDFAKALLNFDHIIVTDIYAAREKNTFGISAQDLVNKINSFNEKAVYIKEFQDIASYVKTNAKPDDIVLTLGAGPINKVGKMILE
ncbi:MAG: UDP-N-acetylmuramate--L-alanine ligase [Clostridia bacterium]|nr:UDP-N-acetylmuramate--L-alanine ligase [Clostridia bacterium]